MMVAILKADQRTYPEPYESPWDVFLCMYCESVFDFHWDARSTTGGHGFLENIN